MKFLRSTVLVATAVAASTFALAQGELRPGIANAGEIETYDEAFAPIAMTPSRFRYLQAGSGPTDPTTPPPTTPPPTTPTPTTPEPTTPEPTTPEPTTPGPTTPEPTTDTPAPTTPGETPTETPAATTEDPSIEVPGTGSGSASESSESSGNGSNTDKLSSGSKTDTGAKDSGSGSNTVTIVAIVGGIVVGVALLAFVAVTCARRRRDEDDDPLSPFELSMDKGYNGAPTFNNTNANANNAALAYSGARTATNSGGAPGFVGGNLHQTQNQTQNQYKSDYSTQFYDVPTSPGYQQQQQQYKKYSSDEIQANDTSLWMSAMEPKDEGTSVPPEVSLPGDDLDDGKNMTSFVSAGSRNSYDAVSEEIDIDQSSVLSGGSDLEKEFPDYEDESSRGSYEL